MRGKRQKEEAGHAPGKEEQQPKLDCFDEKRGVEEEGNRKESTMFETCLCPGKGRVVFSE